MIDFSKIHRFSLAYNLLKFIEVISLKLFFREIHVLNKERIPKDAAVILAPNHQNALMDALAILSCLKGKTFFLARADLFAKDQLAKILRFLCIMPVFRIRDGYSNLNQNDKIIGYCTNLLKRNKRLTIMPEGNHDGFRRLRPLKKGIPRVAFQFAEETQFQKPVFIVPVGLDFSHYWHIGAKLVVNFGEPIDVLQYRSLYESNPAQALVSVNQQISEGLKKRMIHIGSEKFYQQIELLREIGSKTACQSMGLEHQYRPAAIEAQKHLIEKIDCFASEHPEQMQGIAEKVDHYSQLLAQFKMRDHTIESHPYPALALWLRLLLFLVGFPFFAIGAIAGYPTFKLPMLATKKIKDEQFWSSVTFVLGMFITLILFCALLILMGLYLDSFSESLMLSIALVLCGAFAIRYRFNWMKLNSSFRLRKLINKNDPKAQTMLGLRAEIIEFVQQLLLKKNNKPIKKADK